MWLPVTYTVWLPVTSAVRCLYALYEQRSVVTASDFELAKMEL